MSGILVMLLSDQPKSPNILNAMSSVAKGCHHIHCT